MDKNNNLKIQLNQTEAIKCEECGSETFNQVFLLRKVPKLLVGSSTDAIQPIAAFECSKCGTILIDSLPNNLS